MKRREKKNYLLKVFKNEMLECTTPIEENYIIGKTNYVKE